MQFHSSLVTHILLTKSVLPMTVSLKSNVTSENNTMMPWDEVKIGSRKMFVHRACTKLPMNRHSSSVSWEPWMATILSSSLTVHSDRDQYELTTEQQPQNDGFLPMMWMCSRMK